ncbi:hypothetical protein H257_16176 [Aphanomyces astaci]|uniref:Uncharacterized protein n=2 Tax=Aphanomyces astaci TaxID=112090 RepID=W4FLF0_APHAT|nr:hypothetical protein H257_16176 [Aphanomyces astaci]ETV67711.1 hypothetical protein H257_16176 [Aphanomyces astaci]|eukprot:XP_009842832.1 hypothetical protein H257_16176 [Aphanomyces astaci]
MGPGEMVSDDMEVEILDLTFPVAEMGDFGLILFSAGRDAASTVPDSPHMVRQHAISPSSIVPVGVPNGTSNGATGANLGSWTTLSHHPTIPSQSGTTTVSAATAPAPMLRDRSASPPSTGPTRVASTIMDVADPDLGSPVTANDDSGRLSLSTANTVSPGDARSDVSSQATLPARVGDAGSSENVNPRSLPRARGSAASATTATTPPSTDPWAAFAAKRAEATKTARTKDVGVYRPSMADLAPLLAKHAAGTLAFHDTMPIQKHDKREVVGWLHMDTGNHTKAINEDAAMASLLHDNQSLVKGDTLVDVIKCEKDTQNRMLRWGIASDTALRQLQGTTLKLRVTTTSGKIKTTTMMSFQMSLPHALDGFYMDIPAGLQGLFEERLLFETLHHLEPRFLWGLYTSVSATTGLAGSRYRIHFLGSEIPSTMLLDGRMVEEFVFRGRCLRVYGRGWFFRDKRLARLDLDSIAAGTTHVTPTTPPTSTTTATQATPAKRQKTTTKDPNAWTDVRRKPIQSPNAFAALHERWNVGHAVHRANHDGVSFESIIPELHQPDNDLAHPTADEYVTCPKPTKGTVSHVEVPLDDLLAELQLLEAQSNAVRGSEFDSGRVDSICIMMARHPVDFGVQLHRLFTADRPTFELLIRQRLLHRWLRATWGGSASFDKLYTKSFGHKMTRESVTEAGDELTLSRLDLELVLALAEVLAAAHSPLYFASDAAVMVSTGCTIEIIPAHRGLRSLSAPTMLAVLMSTHLGEELWRIMETMFDGDDDMNRVMAHLYDIHESGFVSLPHIGITRWDQELGRFVVPTDEVDDTATPVDDSTMTQVVNRQY